MEINNYKLETLQMIQKILDVRKKNLDALNKHELQLLQINLPELGFNHDVTVNSIKKHYNNIKNNISKAITYYSSLHKLKDKHKIFNFNSRTSFKFADIPTQKTIKTSFRRER